MTKELIYKGRRGLLAVLWQIEVHNIRFQYFNTIADNWLDVDTRHLMDCPILYIFNDFKVHPDDVHRYINESIDHTLVLNEHGEAVAWLAPDEIREV